MKKVHLAFTREMFRQAGQAVLAVAATTAILLLLGRATLGEAVIALLYLVPVGWSASRWGPGAGLCAAVTAALAFDFFFIPPFYTFTVGSLEGWLVLGIFSAVAALLVNRIQSLLYRAHASERDAIFMYELSAALAGLRTQAAVADTLARQLQQMYQADLVRVLVQMEGQAATIVADEPPGDWAAPRAKADRTLPILSASGLVGDIQIWRGSVELPAVESRLLQNFASQAGQALERTRLAEAETRQKDRGVHLNAPIHPN